MKPQTYFGGIFVAIANKNSDKMREQPGVRWFGVLEYRNIWITGIMDDWKIENCDLGL